MRRNVSCFVKERSFKTFDSVGEFWPFAEQDESNNKQIFLYESYDGSSFTSLHEPTDLFNLDYLKERVKTIGASSPKQTDGFMPMNYLLIKIALLFDCLVA